MDPQVSTSFIPKEALAQERARAGGMGIFVLIAIIIFVLSLVAAGGAFAYGQYLTSKLAEDKSSLAAQQGAFDPKSIEDLVRLDSRLTQAKVLLSKHLAPSGIFDFLAQNTLQNVQFTSFSYSIDTDGTADIELDGTTDTFASMALQSDALGKSTLLKDVIFSDIIVGQGGRIGFVVQAKVDPDLISYSKQIADQGAPTAQADQTQTGGIVGTTQTPAAPTAPVNPPTTPSAPSQTKTPKTPPPPSSPSAPSTPTAPTAPVAPSSPTSPSAPPAPPAPPTQ